MVSTELDVKKYLLCIKCKLIVENPYEAECCGSLICANCVSLTNPTASKDPKANSTQSNKLPEICKQCELIPTYKQNLFAKRLLFQMNLSCIFNCGKSFQYSDIRSHLLQCELRQYYCQYCEFSGSKSEFKSHFFESHEDVFFEMIENLNPFSKKTEAVSQQWKDNNIADFRKEDLGSNDLEENNKLFGDLNFNRYSPSMTPRVFMRENNRGQRNTRDKILSKLYSPEPLKLHRVSKFRNIQAELNLKHSLLESIEGDCDISDDYYD